MSLIGVLIVFMVLYPFLSIFPILSVQIPIGEKVPGDSPQINRSIIIVSQCVVKHLLRTSLIKFSRRIDMVPFLLCKLRFFHFRNPAIEQRPDKL